MWRAGFAGSGAIGRPPRAIVRNGTPPVLLQAGTSSRGKWFSSWSPAGRSRRPVRRSRRPFGPWKVWALPCCLSQLEPPKVFLMCRVLPASPGRRPVRSRRSRRGDRRRAAWRGTGRPFARLPSRHMHKALSPVRAFACSSPFEKNEPWSMLARFRHSKPRRARFHSLAKFITRRSKKYGAGKLLMVVRGRRTK